MFDYTSGHSIAERSRMPEAKGQGQTYVHYYWPNLYYAYFNNKSKCLNACTAVGNTAWFLGF